MRQYDLWNCCVEVDETATKNWYAGAETWGCECGHCRNFLTLARQKKLPAPVLETLSRFGIAPEKATYVCQVMGNSDGHLYQFSYRIAGRIIREEPAAEKAGWGEARCCHESYPYGAPGFPEPHFDLELWVTLPWATENDET